MAGIEYIKQAVSELMGNNFGGHDNEHIFRVHDMAMKFCDEIPEANRDLVAAAALLHDCDDYKLFGEESARLLTNTRRILAGSEFDNDFINKCLEIVQTIGYSKRLKGIAPTSIEGKIVSDADMSDATGFIGLVRCVEYRAYRSAGQEPFFDPNCLPGELDIDKYKIQSASPIINHFFDKILRLRDMALTEPGRRCLEKKHQTIYNFLDTYFDEVSAPQEWKDLLAKYK